MGQFDIGLLDVPGTLMMVLDSEGRILLWNRACSELSGYLFDEVRGRPLWDVLLVPEDIEVTQNCFAQLRAGDRPKLEHYWISKSGARRWIAWSLNAVHRPDGTLEFLVGIGVDRTENKQAEEALRLSEAKFAGIIAIAADAIISIDETQRIVLYNEGAEQIFGYARDEVLGKPLDVLLPERFREIHRQHVEAFRTGPIRAMRMGERRPAIFGRRKSGEEFPAEAAISKLDVHGGQLLTVVLRDVTDRKKRDDENARLYQTLHQAGRARDELLGIVAHDLRTPLSAIRMSAELLMRRLPPNLQVERRQIEMIIRSSQRADRLIQDLLDVSRIEASHIALERTTTPTLAVVKDALESNEPCVAAARLTLHTEIKGDLPPIWADRDRVLQVFANLLSNAVKFTPAGGHIVVGADPHGQEVRFWVADTGCGISNEDLQHVFDRFWQAQKSDRRGTGLGLPICKGIIEAHGGRIWIESKVDVGSTFYFTIPVANQVADSPSPAPAL
jgi:PAS domain S-box-containing protein